MAKRTRRQRNEEIFDRRDARLEAVLERPAVKEARLAVLEQATDLAARGLPFRENDRGTPHPRYRVPAGIRRDHNVIFFVTANKMGRPDVRAGWFKAWSVELVSRKKRHAEVRIDLERDDAEIQADFDWLLATLRYRPSDGQGTRTLTRRLTAKQLRQGIALYVRRLAGYTVTEAGRSHELNRKQAERLLSRVTRELELPLPRWPVSVSRIARRARAQRAARKSMPCDYCPEARCADCPVSPTDRDRILAALEADERAGFIKPLR